MTNRPVHNTAVHHEYTFTMIGGLECEPFEFGEECDRIFEFIEGANLARCILTRRSPESALKWRYSTKRTFLSEIDRMNSDPRWKFKSLTTA